VDMEVIATAAVKTRLALCDGLSPFIKEKEKEPVWDGHIYVYSCDSDKNEDLIARVPVQVKGRKRSSEKTPISVKHSVDTVDLKQYSNEGGVFYFLVTINNDGRTTLYYKSLLPFDLHEEIDELEKNSKKSITLKVLPDDNKSIRQIFLAFIGDRKRQATKIIWSEEQAMKAFRDGASINFHIQPKVTPQNYSDLMKETTLQSFYMYVKTKDGVEFPFAEVDENCVVFARQTMDLPVYVGKVKYYDSVSHGYESGQAYIYIGHALRLPIDEENNIVPKHSFKFSLKGTLVNRIVDSDFILALCKSSIITIGSSGVFDLNMDNPKEIAELRRLNNDLKKARVALDYFGIKSDIEFDTLTDIDFRNIDYLIKASEGNDMSFLEKDLPDLFYFKRTIGNTNIRILAEKVLGSSAYKLKNAFNDEALVRLELKGNDNERITIEPWSLYIHMKSEDFLSSNINYSVILNSIKAMKPEDRDQVFRVTDTESISANNMLLQIISAYDSQKKKNKRLLQFAEDMADILVNSEPVTIINRYQVIMRKRLFSNDEVAYLVNLRNECEQAIIKCAISILLGESDEAKRLLAMVPEKEQYLLTNYPIYSMLK